MSIFARRITITNVSLGPQGSQARRSITVRTTDCLTMFRNSVFKAMDLAFNAELQQTESFSSLEEMIRLVRMKDIKGAIKFLSKETKALKEYLKSQNNNTEEMFIDLETYEFSQGLLKENPNNMFLGLVKTFDDALIRENWGEISPIVTAVLNEQECIQKVNILANL